jgi:hypothetical protein
MELDLSNLIFNLHKSDGRLGFLEQKKANLLGRKVRVFTVGAISWGSN